MRTWRIGNVTKQHLLTANLTVDSKLKTNALLSNGKCVVEKLFRNRSWTETLTLHCQWQSEATVEVVSAVW